MNINIPEHSSSNMLHFSGRFAVLKALALNSLGRISAKLITWLDVTVLEGGVGAYKSQTPGFFYLMVAEWARIRQEGGASRPRSGRWGIYRACDTPNLSNMVYEKSSLRRSV